MNRDQERKKNLFTKINLILIALTQSRFPKKKTVEGIPVAQKKRRKKEKKSKTPA